jgi:predicted DNA-binding transcriptional regulator AlpA
MTPHQDGHRNLDGSTAEVRKVDDDLLTMIEVAAIIRAPVATLRYWRHLGTGPHSFRIGRTVRYWRSDVLQWLDSQSRRPQARH